MLGSDADAYDVEKLYETSHSVGLCQGAGIRKNIFVKLTPSDMTK
jgi:hypothetical protein